MVHVSKLQRMRLRWSEFLVAGTRKVTLGSDERIEVPENDEGIDVAADAFVRYRISGCQPQMLRCQNLRKHSGKWCTCRSCSGCVCDGQYFWFLVPNILVLEPGKSPLGMTNVLKCQQMRLQHFWWLMENDLVLKPKKYILGNDVLVEVTADAFAST